MTRSLLSMGVPADDMRWTSGVMGVPISFMDKYNPEQFEIVGSFNANNEAEASFGYVDSRCVPAISQGREISWNGPVINRKPLYKRIVIRRQR